MHKKAEGVTPWQDHATSPHIGDHDGHAGSFAPGLAGMLAAGVMAGGPGSFGFREGYGDYWAYRALGAGMRTPALVGGQVQRAGRFRIGRFCSITALFGRVDMDLRDVVLSHDPDQVTIIVRSLASTVSITVPKGWRIAEQVLVLGSRQAIASRDDNSRAVMFRVRGTMLGGTFKLTDG